MRRRSLVGHLVRAHVVIVAGSCFALAFVALGGGALLLRRNQSESLAELAGSLCHDFETELEEGLAPAEAVAVLFKEIHLANSQVEWVSAGGDVIDRDGSLDGWTPPAGAPATGSHSEGAFRVSTTACAGGSFLRVAAPDVLDHPETALAAWSVLAALPLAVIAGWLVGRRFLRRRLLPLTELRDAAARLDAGPASRLDVPSNATEIADLEAAFNGLLARIGDAFDRERRFTREASHELRTPLTAIRARLERLATRQDGVPENRQEVLAALRDVLDLDHLLDSLLLLARSDSAPLAMTPVNLCDVARDVAHRTVTPGPSAVRLPEVDAPDEILVRGNEDLILRALQNLVDNARKYAGPSARVRVRVSESGGAATVVVDDDGPGIPDDLRPHVFESFTRGAADRTRVTGFGLGLAIVRAIARRHGGEVTSRRGTFGGEEFRIVLPLLSAAEAPVRSADTTRATPTG